MVLLSFEATSGGGSAAEGMGVGVDGVRVDVARVDGVGAAEAGIERVGDAVWWGAGGVGVECDWKGAETVILQRVGVAKVNEDIVCMCGACNERVGVVVWWTNGKRGDGWGAGLGRDIVWLGAMR